MRRFNFSLGNLHAQVKLTREDPRSGLGAAVDRFRRDNVYFVGPYRTWDMAADAATGYDAPLILEKALASARAVVAGHAAYERDTVQFQQPAFSHPLLSWLLLAAATCKGKLHVVDFGGALGSLYWQNRAALRVLRDLTWCVVEQPHIAEAGRVEFADGILDFSDDLESAASGTGANVLLLSGVLQYLPDPHDLLKRALGLGLEFIAIDRTMARTGLPDEAFLQHVPAWIYDATYPVWFLDAATIEKTCRDFGYTLVEETCFEWSTFGYAAPASVREFTEWNVDIRSLGNIEGWPYRGWLFRRSEAGK